MSQKTPVGFVDVNVIPMDSERVLTHKTVITDRGKIVGIYDVSKIAPPQGAIRVDGRGRYLMPGLADMHTHTWAEADFLLFLANGTVSREWLQEIRNRALVLLAALEKIESGGNSSPKDSSVSAGPSQA